MNMRDSSVAAVYDSGIIGDTAPGLDIPTEKWLHSIGVENGRYFNSGVLLVNLDYWREEGLMSKALDYISKNGSKLVFYDQDVLNALLHDCKLFLPFRYNVQDGFLRRKRRIRPESIAALDQELLHPVIIHYTGGKKPWQYKSQHPYKGLYFHYLDLTPWKGERPVVPFSYKLKRVFDQLLYFMRLARPKYRKCIELCPKNS